LWRRGIHRTAVIFIKYLIVLATQSTEHTRLDPESWPIPAGAPRIDERKEDVMAEFVSFEPGVQVLGEVIQAFVAAFPSEVRKVGLDILGKHGISNAQSGEYYPVQSLFDAMKEISEKFTPQMLFRIGEQIAGNAKLPPGIDSLETCLSSIDTAYHMNHRGGHIGSYTYSYTGVEGGLHRAKMVCPNPYPCAFDRGVIEGFAKRFKPPDCLDVLVKHDDSQACRRNGAESCAFLISWG
jgi:hypothetical protein